MKPDHIWYLCPDRYAQLKNLYNYLRNIYVNASNKSNDRVTYRYFLDENVRKYQYQSYIEKRMTMIIGLANESSFVILSVNAKYIRLYPRSNTVFHHTALYSFSDPTVRFTIILTYCHFCPRRRFLLQLWQWHILHLLARGDMAQIRNNSFWKIIENTVLSKFFKKIIYQIQNCPTKSKAVQTNPSDIA